MTFEEWYQQQLSYAQSDPYWQVTVATMRDFAEEAWDAAMEQVIRLIEAKAALYDSREGVVFTEVAFALSAVALSLKHEITAGGSSPAPQEEAPGAGTPASGAPAPGRPEEPG